MNAPALALAAKLQSDRLAAKRFLTHALDLDLPTAESLVANGLPRWEADEMLGHLRRAGEVGPEGWNADIRQRYRGLLAEVMVQHDSALAVKKDPRQRFSGGIGPREKALSSGIDSLSDDELLALLLRTGTAEEAVMELAARLLAEHDGLVGLAGMDVAVLVRAVGLGPAKAGEIAAAFELARRLARSARRQRPKLTSPEAVAELLAADLAPLNHEQFLCLPLDARSALLGEPHRVSKGDIDGTEAGPRLFFRHALISGAASAIAVHNHPTGDPSPSAADLAVTRRLVAAGATLDCPLQDHLIIGDGGRFTSLRRNHPECFARQATAP